MVDLGANEGYFTLIGAQIVGSGGRVLAIEPQARLQAVVRENLRLNGVGNVKIANVAGSDRRGVAQMHLAADTNSGSSGLSKVVNYRLPVQDVEMRTLSDLLDQELSGRIDFMKVDIEGGESEAILGSPDLFRQHRVRVLALELHPRQLAERGKDPDDLVRFMNSCGYTNDPAAPSVWIAPEGP